MPATRAELTAFGHAPGHYLCRCIDCPDVRDTLMNGNRNQFEGSKGSYRCETHATAAMARHRDEQNHAAELARPGLTVLVGDKETSLRITGIAIIEFGMGLHITALTKNGDKVTFVAKRVADNA
jgi:hypothetical protein